jgi:YfiH family protein
MFELSEEVVAAFSMRRDRNMSLVYGDTSLSLDNRKNFLSALNIDYRDLVCAKQVHGSRIQYVREQDKGRGALSYDGAIAETDALLTDRKNLPLAIFTADCLSVFLYDPVTPAIGLVHAGWQGTKDQITAKALRQICSQFNSHPQDILVAFGPFIRSCCYEVKDEFKKFFSGGLIKKDERYYLDLESINRQQAQDGGVRPENIISCGICTACRNEDFFSYRKELTACGRMISVMMLKA